MSNEETKQKQEANATIRTDNSKVIATLDERVRELEAENKELKEAIQLAVKIRYGAGGDIVYRMNNVLEQALKPKP